MKPIYQEVTLLANVDGEKKKWIKYFLALSYYSLVLPAAVFKQGKKDSPTFHVRCLIHQGSESSYITE